jgi:lipoate-protein ligase A
LLIARAKVVGSAQRSQRGALLQHGAILFAASPHTPHLPGIRELTNISLTAAEVIERICNAFASNLPCELVERAWTAAEHQRIDHAVQVRYGTDSWNRKR